MQQETMLLGLSEVPLMRSISGAHFAARELHLCMYSMHHKPGLTALSASPQLLAVIARRMQNRCDAESSIEL